MGVIVPLTADKPRRRWPRGTIARLDGIFLGIGVRFTLRGSPKECGLRESDMKAHFLTRYSVGAPRASAKFATASPGLIAPSSITRSVPSTTSGVALLNDRVTSNSRESCFPV